MAPGRFHRAVTIWRRWADGEGWDKSPTRELRCPAGPLVHPTRDTTSHRAPQVAAARCHWQRKEPTPSHAAGDGWQQDPQKVSFGSYGWPSCIKEHVSPLYQSWKQQLWVLLLSATPTWALGKAVLLSPLPLIARYCSSCLYFPQLF